MLAMILRRDAKLREAKSDKRIATKETMYITRVD